MIDGLKDFTKSIPELLRGLDAIKTRRETYLEMSKARFNIFTILRDAEEEVALHSKFLASLLDIAGTHDCKDRFFKLFIEVLNEEGICNHYGENLKNYFSNEYQISAFEKLEREKNKPGFGNIDIGIYFKDAVLIIENKIYAREQEKQIYRYCQFVQETRKKSKVVIYLTLDGRQSSTAGEHACNYYRISYSLHILKWIERCLEETYKYPNINNVIQQYKNVVIGLTKKDNLAETDMQEITELIKKYPRLIKYAKDIKAGVDNIKQKQINSLWELFQNELEKKGFKRTESTAKDQGEVLKRLVIKSSFIVGLEDERFDFLVEKADNSIYAGIVQFNEEKKKQIYSNYKDSFIKIISAIEISAIKENRFCFSGGNESWPIGSTKLLDMNDEWFMSLVENNDTDKAIGEIAIKMAGDVERCFRVVEEECKLKMDRHVI